MNRTRGLAPFIPYAVVSAVHVGLLAVDHPFTYPTKLMLMPLLALAAVWASTAIRPLPRGPLLLLLAAICFSWFGDGAAFFFPGLPELPMMLASFGLAHVGYVVLIWKVRGVARGGFPSWALVYAAAYVALMVVLLPRTGSLAVPVAIYGMLLVATAAMAARCGAVIAWGGAWFLASDSILAFRLFLPEIMPAWTSPAVMLTYALGQGLIVYGVVAALRARVRVADAVQEGAVRTS